MYTAPFKTREHLVPCLSNKGTPCSLFLVLTRKTSYSVPFVFLQIITHNHGIEYDPNLHWYWPDYYESGGD
jgi:hypothetical protein